MENFYSKIQILICASLFLVISVTALSENMRFTRKYTLPSSRMRMPEEMMGTDDFDLSFDALEDDNETQEHFLEAFEELAPEIQDTILYFYDENLKLTEKNIQLSYVVDYLLKVFPIKLEVYIQQEPISINPYNYNKYQQYPIMDPGPGPISFYPQNPYGFGYAPAPVQFALPMGLGLTERDKRFSMQPRKFYRFQDVVKDETKNGDHTQAENEPSDKDEQQYSVEQIVLLFLLDQCSQQYLKTKEMLPPCALLITQMIDAVDKIKLEESIERINLRRGMRLTS